MTRNQALDLCIAAGEPVAKTFDPEAVITSEDIGLWLVMTPGERDRLAALNEMAELGHGFPGLTTTQRSIHG